MNIKKILFAVSTLVMAFGASAAFAEEAAAATTKGEWAPLAAALAIGIAAFGGAMGQGKAATAALEGIARNPAAQNKIFVPMIIALALIESLVIYALLIAFRLA